MVVQLYLLLYLFYLAELFPDYKTRRPTLPYLNIFGSLSRRVFETRTATGREHFACQDSDLSKIFILTISNGGKILSNINVVV